MIVIVCISMCACVSTHHIMFACVYIIFLSIGSFVLPCLLLFFFRTFFTAVYTAYAYAIIILYLCKQLIKAYFTILFEHFSRF